MISTPNDIHHILSDATHLLFDFDGPICSIFAGLPAATVAATLRDYLAPLRLALPDSILSEDDPLEILRYAAGAGPLLTETTEAGLRGLELQAILSATPTPDAAEAIRHHRASGRRLAVVSNNADIAVQIYLTHHNLLGHFDLISARTPGQDPALLKPHPHLIAQAIDRLGADPEKCVLIGDSVSDVHGAERAGIPAIGYANAPGQAYRLHAAGAAAVITRMTQLLPQATPQR